MDDSKALTVEVARELTEPLEDLAGTLRQPASWIVNRALREYIDRRWRPAGSRAGDASTSSYIELTRREESLDLI